MSTTKSCPVSRAQFAAATPVTITMGDGQTITATPKTFSTGSFGFNGVGKVTVMVDGKPAIAQVSINLVLVGSKAAA